jgi:hypothetical protein
MEFVQTKDRLVEFFDFFYTHRTIYLDGRKLPDDPEGTWYGYSVGHWDGNTLIVETIGFNDESWLTTMDTRIATRCASRSASHGWITTPSSPS